MKESNRNCPICGAYEVYYLEDKDKQFIQQKFNEGDLYCKACLNVTKRIKSDSQADND